MSSTIWTQCAGSSEVGPLATTAWRAVEAQHQVATRKLVDSLEEQALLESILEDHKPPPAAGALHYLLAHALSLPAASPRVAIWHPRRARYLVRSPVGSAPPSPRWPTTVWFSSTGPAPTWACSSSSSPPTRRR